MEILFPFKILKGMSSPDDFVSSNVEITSGPSLAVTEFSVGNSEN